MKRALPNCPRQASSDGSVVKSWSFATPSPSSSCMLMRKRALMAPVEVLAVASSAQRGADRRGQRPHRAVEHDRLAVVAGVVLSVEEVVIFREGRADVDRLRAAAGDLMLGH